MSQDIALPVTGREYNQVNEQKTRRTIEISFQDLRNDIVNTRNSADSDVTLGLRRHQFLLMGS